MANEPQWLTLGDERAQGIDPRCEECDERHPDDECGVGSDDPDNLYDSMFERD
jgi:hypothetical protein